jgi:hypothetical protein
MLSPPTKGFALSVNKHNVELDALVEWIEGCITFDEKRVSQIDVVDILLEEQFYRNQDFAKSRVNDAWNELSRRARCLGSASPFRVSSSHIEQLKSWKRTAAYAFCLMLSLQVSYRSAFTAIFGTDYTEQGMLFERLTAESIGALGWKTHATGWSKEAPASIFERVEALAQHLGEPSRAEAIGIWTEADAKDGGLDVVCHIPFRDEWSGRSLYFVQCASGENWKEKRSTPDIALWDKLLDFATRPSRGLSIPFALLANDFRRAANSDNLSLVLDRHRLSAPSETTRKTWLSKQLTRDLNNWTQERIAAIAKVRVS